jgi:hypothetical protein
MCNVAFLMALKLAAHLASFDANLYLHSSCTVLFHYVRSLCQLRGIELLQGVSLGRPCLFSDKRTWRLTFVYVNLINSLSVCRA